MKEQGEIVGYEFIPSPQVGKGEQMFDLHCCIKYSRGTGKMFMASFTKEQKDSLLRFKDRLIHDNPEPIDPRTNWVEYIEGL